MIYTPVEQWKTNYLYGWPCSQSPPGLLDPTAPLTLRFYELKQKPKAWEWGPTRRYGCTDSNM